MDNLGVEAKSILFSDENPENVLTARKIDINAECSKTREVVISASNRLGLNI